MINQLRWKEQIILNQKYETIIKNGSMPFIYPLDTEFVIEWCIF